MTKNKKIITSIVLLAILFLAIIILSFWMSVFKALRIVFGVSFVLFLPGFIFSYVFFPSQANFLAKNESERQEIDSIERIILSFALSMAMVPLLIFLMNKLGMIINLVNSLIVIFGIILIGLLIIYFRKRVRKI